MLITGFNEGKFDTLGDMYLNLNEGLKSQLGLQFGVKTQQLAKNIQNFGEEGFGLVGSTSVKIEVDLEEGLHQSHHRLFSCSTENLGARECEYLVEELLGVV